MKQVEKDSQGKVTMGPGTLYGSLKRMLEAGLVEESAPQFDPAMDDKRRIYYKITGLGKNALTEELARYRHLLSVAEEKKLFPEIFTYGI